jgi:hypothetical protein
MLADEVYEKYSLREKIQSTPYIPIYKRFKMFTLSNDTHLQKRIKCYSKKYAK